MKQGRRQFLHRALRMSGLLALANLLGIQRAAAFWFGGKSLIAVGKVGDLTDGAMTPVTEATTVKGGKPAGKLQLFVIHKNHAVYAMSARCTHAGCTVQLKNDGTFRCPCHGALFDSRGVVVKGPAKESLAWLHVEVTHDGEIRVDLKHQGPKAPTP